MYCCSIISYSQNVGINITGATPDPSAMLDIVSTTSGILIPRMTSAQKTAITAPATGLLIYQTDGVTGYYYYDGLVWLSLFTSTNGWSLIGNATTTPGTHFLGTTDAVDLVFKTNGTENMRIQSGGNVGIGTNNPEMPLQIGTNTLLTNALKIANIGALWIADHGKKIYFGDNGISNGNPSDGVHNVSIGEGGNTDSDILQLHGKYGISFTNNGVTFDPDIIRMFIDPYGMVGIGPSTSPSCLLNVNNDNNTAGYKYFEISNAQGGSAGSLYFANGGFAADKILFLSSTSRSPIFNLLSPGGNGRFAIDHTNGELFIGTDGTADVNIGYGGGTGAIKIDGATGNVGIGTTGLTARLHLPAGTATSNSAPLKFTSGVNLTTPEAGVIEFDGAEFYATPTTNRYTIPMTLRGSATLNFASTPAGGKSDLTITVSGAADGDAVFLGVPNASSVANGCFTAWVSAANTVTVRFTNNDLSSTYDPASGTFKVTVNK